MGLNNTINEYRNTLNNIRNSLANKGVTDASTTVYSQVAGKIDNIQVFDDAAFLSRTMTDLTTSTNTFGDYCCYNYYSLNSVSAPLATSVGVGSFQNCNMLRSVDAPLTTLGNLSFSGCGNLRSLNGATFSVVPRYCFNFANNVFDGETLYLSKIESYGLYRAGSATTNKFNIVFNNGIIEQLGCSTAGVQSIEGNISSVGSSGLAIASLINFNANINGPVGTNGLALTNKLKNVDWANSNITNVAANSFLYMGRDRTNYSTEVALYDFRNSSFPTLEQMTFGYLRYANLYLPNTIISIAAYAFRYDDNVNIYFTSENVPTLNSSSFTNVTNYKIYVPYNSFNAYRTASNWSAQVANMCGFLPANSYPAGTVLPSYNREGYALTWYDDRALTNVVTTIPAGSPELYCTLGSTQDKYSIKFIIGGDNNTSITLEDSLGSQLDIFDGYAVCDPNDTVALNVTTIGGGSANVKVNGTQITSFPYQFTVSGSDVVYVYSYDVNTLNSDFDNATWEEIQEVVKAGEENNLYSNYIGHTKTVTLTDNTTHTVRLANVSGNLYEKLDGTGWTGFILEFIDNIGTGNQTAARNVESSATLFALIPDEIKNIASKVTVKYYKNGDSAGVKTVETRFSSPAVTELGFSQPTGTEQPITWAIYNTDPQTYRHPTYWTRTGGGGANNGGFILTSKTAYNNGSYSSNNSGISPFFCI